MTRQLDAVRKRVLIHMGFNMGVPRLLTMTRFVSAVESRAWDTAANEMLNSEWANREPHRTSVMAAMMRTGRDDVLSVIHPKTA